MACGGDAATPITKATEAEESASVMSGIRTLTLFTIGQSPTDTLTSCHWIESITTVTMNQIIAGGLLVKNRLTIAEKDAGTGDHRRFENGKEKTIKQGGKI